jgi:hypothetical protein
MKLALTILILLNIPSTKARPYFRKTQKIIHDAKYAALFFSRTVALQVFRMLYATLSRRLFHLFSMIHPCQLSDKGSGIS